MTRAALARMARGLHVEFTDRSGKLNRGAAQGLAASPKRLLRGFRRRHGITASDRDLRAHLPGGKSEYST